MFLNINAWLSIKIWLDSESCHHTKAVKISICKKCEYKFNVSIYFVFLALLLKKL